MTSAGWRTVRGGMTAPKWLMTAKLDGWLTVGSLHTAPTVRWVRGRMIGPSKRRASYREHSTRLVHWLRSQTGPVLVGGDWNAQQRDWGTYSPRWVARLSKSRLRGPKRATHGKRRRIDFLLLRGGVFVETISASDYLGSDHRLVLFRVAEDR